MSRRKPFHHDKGNGVCDGCWEEWPCASVTGDSDGISLDQWEREEQRREHDRQEAARRALADELVPMAEELGLSNVVRQLQSRWLSHSFSMTLDELAVALGHREDG